MTSDAAPTPPTLDEPDWQRIHQTVLMLNLAVAQIGNTMREGDESVNTLTDTFATMMNGIQDIHQHARQLSASKEGAAINAACEAVGGDIQKTIVAFQFYDKLSQRLTHLSHSLARFGELLESHQLVHDPDAWQNLQDDIKARFPVESDKAMFEAILAGATVAEVLEYLHMEAGSEDEEGVEFF